jgi:dCMP deaminase
MEERHKRPAKYRWIEHAERNAIYEAASEGRATKGGTMYLPWYPCSDCARGIIQCKLAELVGIEPDWDDPSFGPDFLYARDMLAEAGIRVRLTSGDAPVASMSAPTRQR